MQEYLKDAIKIGMIDIETLDVHRTNSVITEVGVLTCNMLYSNQHNSIVISDVQMNVYYLPLLKQIIQLGRSFSQDTLKFREKHKFDLRAHVETHAIEEMVAEITNKLTPMNVVWVNGPDFDLGNLSSISRQVNVSEEFYDFRKTRDLRTIRSELDIFKNYKRTGDHTSAGDCQDMLEQLKLYYEHKCCSILIKP